MKYRLTSLLVVPALLAAALALSAAPAVAQLTPRSTDPAETLLRRAAYQETQKQESAKAVDLYREVVKRYPDSPSAAKALERIAALERQLGDEAAAREATAQLEALRAKLATNDEKPKEGADAQPLRARREALAKLPPDLRKRVEELRAQGLPPEQIRATIRREMVERARQKNLRGEIEKIVADGRAKGQSPAEIRARVRKFLEEQRAKRGEDSDGKTTPAPKKSRFV